MTFIFILAYTVILCTRVVVLFVTKLIASVINTLIIVTFFITASATFIKVAIIVICNFLAGRR